MNNLDLLLPDEGMPDAHRWATVTDDSPLRIKLDGDSVALPVTPDTLVASLAIDDRVLVLMTSGGPTTFHGRRVIILGKSQA